MVHITTCNQMNPGVTNKTWKNIYTRMVMNRRSCSILNTVLHLLHYTRPKHMHTYICHFTTNRWLDRQTSSQPASQLVSRLVGQSILASSPCWDSWPDFNVLSDHYRFGHDVVSSLTKGWACYELSHLCQVSLSVR